MVVALLRLAISSPFPLQQLALERRELRRVRDGDQSLRQPVIRDPDHPLLAASLALEGPGEDTEPAISDLLILEGPGSVSEPFVDGVGEGVLLGLIGPIRGTCPITDDHLQEDHLST